MIGFALSGFIEASLIESYDWHIFLKKMHLVQSHFCDAIWFAAQKTPNADYFQPTSLNTDNREDFFLTAVYWLGSFKR